MKYIIYTTKDLWHKEAGTDVNLPDKPLQVFNNKEDADEALKFFLKYYDYNVKVFPEKDLKELKELEDYLTGKEDVFSLFLEKG